MKGRFVRANQLGVDELAPLSPQQLTEYLDNHLVPQGLTAGFGGMIALVDGLIHHQDIRRALQRPRAIPADRLRRVLGLVPNNPRLGARRWIRGLRLRATDLDWAHGRGPATDSARQAGPEGGRPAGRAALVVDPVCGMTVSADSSRPLRYEGTDYYFCCAGCRQAFEQDPDAYLKRETRC